MPTPASERPAVPQLTAEMTADGVEPSSRGKAQPKKIIRAPVITKAEFITDAHSAPGEPKSLIACAMLSYLGCTAPTTWMDMTSITGAAMPEVTAAIRRVR